MFWIGLIIGLLFSAVIISPIVTVGLVMTILDRKISKWIKKWRVKNKQGV
jgi:hypothetical protein